MMIVMPNRSTDFVVCIFIFLACCYISASVPSCKVYQSTHVDCTYRDLTSVPRHLPSSTTHLDLSYNHIANLSPRDFENLHSLEELTMWIADDLHIDSGTFVGLQRLRSLRFLGNGYLTFGKETFKHLSSLQTLEIPIKSVTHMPEYVFSNLTNLSKLSIHVPAQVRADYTLLPSSLLRGLRYLEEFSFDGVSFANLSRESFADSQNLKTVHIELSFLDCGQIEILNSLKKLETVSFNMLHVKTVCNVTFSIFPSLKEVSFDGIVIYDDAFPVFDFSKNNLHKLYIKLPSVTYEEANQLPRLLLSTVSQLKITGHVDLRTFEYFLTSLRNVSINFLSVYSVGLFDEKYRYNITDTTFESLVDSNLQEIYIYRNPLETISAKSFLWLAQLKTLHIDLCNLGDDTFVSLHGLTTLTTLILTNNKFHSFNHLLSAISEMKNLRNLDVSRNMLEGQIDEYAFRKHQALTSINLSGNRFSSIRQKSFSLLLNLQHLDLSQNNINLVPNGAFHTLTTLNSLLLFNNELFHQEDPGQNRHPFENLTNLTNLTLTVKNLNLVNIIYLEDTPHLESLHIDGNQAFKTQLFSENLRLEYLTWLVVENINFEKRDEVSVILNTEVINVRPREFLTNLLLPYNNFDQLNFTSLNDFRNLVELSVANNKLSVVRGTPNKLNKLETLDLSGNLITVLSSEILTISSLRLLKVNGNPFDCSCKMKPFKDWLRKDEKSLVYSNYLYIERNTCSLPKSKYGIPVNAVDLGLECNLALIISVPLTCFIVIVIIAVAFVRRFHWHMRFAYFHIKLRPGGYQLQINDEEQPINKRYDAFVVYNQHDSDWVIHELIPHLENIDPPNNYKLCIHERDFLPGYDIFENILDSIEQSKKTMLILSPGFAASEWCYFEMRMAQSCLFEEKRDIIVMVSLEKFPDDDMPRILRNILLTKSYLEWPENGMGRSPFWEKLKVALRSDSRVNRVAAL